jgi:CNT family concentrative nucleoside transporter
MGIPAAECFTAGQLLGTKMVVNEFLAYFQLGQIMESDQALVAAGKATQRQLSDRSATILTYALCGFANFSSIGIQLGGIGGIAPERRSDLARLGLRAMIGGTLAAFMTACVAGLLI